MAKTVLFTFETSTQREQFISAVGDAIRDDQTISGVLDTIRFDPPMRSDSERMAALFVSGKKLEEGPLETMRRKFSQEIASHSANTELKELRSGEWVSIQSRKIQKP